MTDIAIRVEGLSKRYRIGAKQEKYKTLRDTLTEGALRPIRALKSLTRPNGHNPESNPSSKPQSAIRNPQPELIWALNDVSFEVKRGEVVGIIGRNGAGKSTLLKILSRITEPTSGYADIHGRVGSLLEVGTGFHPELTGRENIYLNGSILGMKRTEIDRRFDEIVAFAEVEKFIDTPVKHYSSGMYLRLAFAVAAHLETEILLVDEVLAVGDIAFQKKCLGKMEDVAKAGRTILFVSHNLNAIESLCCSAVVLSEGTSDFNGCVESAIERYSRETIDSPTRRILNHTKRSGSGRVRFHTIEVGGEIDPSGNSVIVPGKQLSIHLKLRSDNLSAAVAVPTDVAIIIKDSRGQKIATLANFFTGQCSTAHFEGASWTISCVIERLPLLEGHYHLDLWCARGPELLDLIPDALTFRVSSGSFFITDDARKPIAHKHGSVFVVHDWFDTNNCYASPARESSIAIHTAALAAKINSQY